MKTANIQVLLIVLLAAVALADQFDQTYSFDDFVRQYHRTYQGQERAAHEAAFKINYAELLKYKKEGHDVVPNERLDWIPEQKARFFSYRPEKSKLQPSTRPVTSSSLFASPSSFDWRTYGRVTPVKDQGNCGSCWSFAATAQYQSMLAIATRGTLYDLAEQYGLECQTTSYGCSGGYPYETLQLFQSTGIPLETAYPYNYDYSYPNICTNTTGRVKINQTVNTVNFYYYQNLTVEQMQQDLVTYGPIGVGVYASGSFSYTGSSGLIDCTSSGQIDHAILLVGYTTTHWIVKNSWGTDSWGDNGYGYITKNTNNDCRIRQYVTEMVVDFGFSPTDPGYLNLTITLSDSFGDGWNGNVLAIKQNNTIVGTFGSTFTSGSTKGPFYIVVQSTSEVRIVVSTLGTKTNEVGFVVKAPNGTVIHQRNSGTTFTAATVFSTFCPLGGCPATMDLTVTLTDSFGDGWNGTVFGFKQNATLIGTFGSAFTTGSSSGPFYITVTKKLNARLVVTTLGTKTNEVGFVIKAPNGTVIFQRASGTTFTATTYFTIFCPDSGCPNTLDLIITMTDSGSNGWSKNILAIKQNNTIVGTFGTNFTSGASSGPIQITIQGNLSTQIVVLSMGSNTQEIGFTVAAPNGTVFYQRTSGAAYPPSIIFSIFCPVSGCAAPSPSYLTLTITMTDSGSDGWNSNVLAIRQNNKIVGFFGNTFTTGSSSGPVSVIVQGNLATQIVVATLGTKTNEIGFTVTAPNGTIIHQRSSGATFLAATRFSTFCPVGGCANILSLTITMTDSGSDGWNGNILGIRQLNQNNAVVGTFGAAFTSGASSGPVYVAVLGNFQTRIFVSTLGTKTNQVGFIVKASNGTVIYQRNSGTTFTAATTFATFCPLGGCPNLNSSFLTITMTDSVGDGWNQNTLGIMQSNSLVGTFGSDFTIGLSVDPVYIQVQANATGTIFVNQLGSGTNEVGFTVKAPNGTTVYQRSSGAAFDSSTIFSSFCLLGGCPIPTTLNLTIIMSDSYGDGWNGNILAIKQNNTVQGTFGSAFTSGSTTPNVYIVVQGNIKAQIVVSTLGSWTAEVEFIVKAPNGTVIYQRNSGSYFYANTIFKSFCPIGGCPLNPNVIYYLNEYDSYGDGWQGTVLAFKNNGTVLYTFTLQSGYSNTSIPFSFVQLSQISITVYTLGNYASQVGIMVSDADGNTIFQRPSGTKFYANTLLGTFCVGCTNSRPANILPGITEEKTKYNNQSQQIQKEPPNKGYMIATFVLASVLVISLIILFTWNFKLRRQLSTYKSIETQKEKVEEGKQTVSIESAQEVHAL